MCSELLNRCLDMDLSFTSMEILAKYFGMILVKCPKRYSTNRWIDMGGGHVPWLRQRRNNDAAHFCVERIDSFLNTHIIYLYVICDICTENGTISRMLTEIIRSSETFSTQDFSMLYSGWHIWICWHEWENIPWVRILMHYFAFTRNIMAWALW